MNWTWNLRINFMTFVMVYSDFNNVCDLGTDMIWTLLKRPKKRWEGFVKLSMIKRINLRKI